MLARGPERCYDDAVHRQARERSDEMWLSHEAEQQRQYHTGLDKPLPVTGPLKLKEARRNGLRQKLARRQRAGFRAKPTPARSGAVFLGHSRSEITSSRSKSRTPGFPLRRIQRA